VSGIYEQENQRTITKIGMIENMAYSKIIEKLNNQLEKDIDNECQVVLFCHE